MQILSLLSKKRSGGILSKEEIEYIVNGFVREEIPDYQMASLMMAIFLKGMSKEEIIHFTQALALSGEVINWTGIEGKRIDKHSTGGVGDGTSLILAPLVAAAGISVPMICGKGLGHTGGTVDKLESIPGFKTNLSIRQFIEQVGKIGIAIIGQTNQINPADKKIYALRNATATVESIPLIASSIMSKKIVEGVEGLILDVKVGKGSFIKKKTRAKKLAAFMVEIGKVFGIKTIALITNMDQPLGEMIGNALEVKQAINILKGKGPQDIKELVFYLGSLMLITGKKVKNIKEGERVLKELIEKGKALEKFKEMVIAQGGDGQIINNPDKILPQAKKRIKIQTLESGYLQSMDAREVGIATMLLGAGREKLDAHIDYAVGIELHKKVGDRVEKGEPVATFHVNNETKLPLAQEMFLSACKIGRKRAKKISLIYEEIR